MAPMAAPTHGVARTNSPTVYFGAAAWADAKNATVAYLDLDYLSPGAIYALACGRYTDETVEHVLAAAATRQRHIGEADVREIARVGATAVRAIEADQRAEAEAEAARLLSLLRAAGGWCPRRADLSGRTEQRTDLALKDLRWALLEDKSELSPHRARDLDRLVVQFTTKRTGRARIYRGQLHISSTNSTSFPPCWLSGAPTPTAQQSAERHHARVSRSQGQRSLVDETQMGTASLRLWCWRRQDNTGCKQNFAHLLPDDIADPGGIKVPGQ
jgi:hypothetical protein